MNCWPHSDFLTLIFTTLSNVSGEGISELKTHLMTLAAEKLNPEIKPSDQEARFLIDRSFSVKGIGTVVTGCLRSGQMSTGDQLVQGLSGNVARVRSIRLDRDTIQTLHAGQRAASINLDQTSVKRGGFVAGWSIHHTVRRFDCRIQAAKLPHSFKPSAQYHLYPVVATISSTSEFWILIRAFARF